MKPWVILASTLLVGLALGVGGTLLLPPAIEPTVGQWAPRSPQVREPNTTEEMRHGNRSQACRREPRVCQRPVGAIGARHRRDGGDRQSPVRLDALRQSDR